VQELKRLALDLRERLGMRDIRYLNMLEVLEAMKRVFPDFDYKRVKDAKLKDSDGFYDSELPYLQIPDTTWSKLERNEPRARFTCAHEIGHWILRHEGFRFRRSTRQAYERSTPNIRRDERDAEQFAAFLLAPDHLAEKFNSLSELQTTFGFSRRAAEIRKNELDADARRKRGELRALPEGIISFLEQAQAKGYKVTSLPSQPQPNSQTDKQRTDTTESLKIGEEVEICVECGNLTLSKEGLQMVCKTCGKQVAL
jgi:Zn-dependent peptidase ImmA (M78 family)